jgi:hypothetical protein
LLNDLEKDKIFNELDYIISEEEILKTIKELKNNKAAGFDIIINEMLIDDVCWYDYYYWNINCKNHHRTGCVIISIVTSCGIYRRF